MIDSLPVLCAKSTL
uniref:Uncharacterized protein n=1 Tax=Rhizophora mucronata TaxID=61149 RepID=A0A2P2R0I3_RHIMU